MYVVIMGSGRVGATLANQLSREGHKVAIIDIAPEPFQRYLAADFRGRTILGDGIDQEVLREAGIEEADAFVAAAHGDNHNLMAAQIARLVFKVPRVVARCNDPVRMAAFEGLGLTTICPSLMAADALNMALLAQQTDQEADPASSVVPAEPQGT